MSLVNLLIAVLILCIMGGLLWYIVRMLPLPPPFKLIAELVLLLIFVLVLVSWLFGGISIPGVRLG